MNQPDAEDVDPRNHPFLLESMREEDMLTRIAGALGRERGTACGPPPPPFKFRPAVAEDLLEQFSVEATRVGARVTVVSSEIEISNHLEELIDAAADSVCLSDFVVRKFPSVAQRLLATGARQVGRGAAEANIDDFRRSLLEVTIGITSCDYAIADTGTLVVVSGGERHGLLSLLPPIHICIFSARRLVRTFADLTTKFASYACAGLTPARSVTCITGPSRTADIEHTVTLGVHGPCELHVLIDAGKM